MKTKKIVSLVLAMVMVLSFSSVFVLATEGCYLSNAVFPTTDAPTINGAIGPDEYGTPVIVTSQADANKAEDDLISWTDQNAMGGNADQKAKIYMTYDKDYLYIAATLDHAQPNQLTGGGGGYHPHLAVTLSKKDNDGVYKNTDEKEVYLFSRVHLDKNGTSGFYAAEFTADLKSNGSNTSKSVNGITYGAKYDDETKTYTYEMRIQWAKAPGLVDEKTNQYNGAEFAMAIEVADGVKNTKNQPSYYQIGADAAHQGVFNKEVNPHGTNVVTFTPNNQFRVTNSVALMPNVAPDPNGTVAEGEYGDPIIITSQSHANNKGNDPIAWIEMQTSANTAQQAKIYMTNDADYLYIAATLDNATKDLWPDKGNGGYHPHLAITASKFDNGGVLKDGETGKENYLFSRVHLENASQTAGIWATNRFENVTYNEGEVIYNAKYDEDNTYHFEMQIPWSAIPGMTDSYGLYNGATLAMNIELADGEGSAKKLEGSYYWIGGTVAHQGNWNTGASHGDDVMAISCNIPFTEQTVVGTTEDLQSALANAHSGDIIALDSDITVDEDVVIKNGVMLDLNGKVLTANSVTAFDAGSFIKDSQDGVGGIKVPEDKLHFTSTGKVDNNNQLPLYDEDTYRFYDCQPNQLISTTRCKFGFQFTMAAGAYDLLADPDAVGISLENNMVLTKDDKTIELEFPYNTARISEYADKKNDGTSKNPAIILTVTGFEKVNATVITLKSVPTIVSSTGVKIAAESQTYTHTNTIGE